MGHVITLPCTVKAKRNEVILDPRRDFRGLVEEYMGYEAADLFDEILEEVAEEIDDLYAEGKRRPDGDDYEAISDGYRGQLVDILNDLKEVVFAKRLNRKRLEEITMNLERNL